MVRRDRQQQPTPEEGYPGESGTPTTPATPDTAITASAHRGHIPETVPDLPSDRIQAEYAPGTDRPDRQPDMPPTAAAVAPPRDEDAPRKMTAEDKVCAKHLVPVPTTLQNVRYTPTPMSDTISAQIPPNCAAAYCHLHLHQPTLAPSRHLLFAPSASALASR